MSPLVSVWMVTYNHEKFIAEALDSVLMQVTDFDFEIVIGEDCSKDGTRAIIREYEQKYPHLIRAVYHEQNVGASRNAYEFTLPICKGKYVACLEGDDYWTDPGKLQKQVDFLEANDDFSASGHQAIVFYDDGSAESYKFGEDRDRVYTMNDMISHRKFHTAALMFRSEIFRKTGGIPFNILSGDRAIFAMLSVFGKVMYFKEAMCTYRKSSVGMSNYITSYELEKDLNMLPWIRKADKHFPVRRLKSFIHLCIYTYPAQINFSQLLKHYLLFALASFSYFPKNLGDLKWGTIFFFRKLRK